MMTILYTLYNYQVIIIVFEFFFDKIIENVCRSECRRELAGGRAREMRGIERAT